MEKFKLGDRVERIAIRAYGKIGDVGTIVDVDEEDDYLVRWDSYVVS